MTSAINFFNQFTLFFGFLYKLETRVILRHISAHMQIFRIRTDEQIFPERRWPPRSFIIVIREHLTRIEWYVNNISMQMRGMMYVMAACKWHIFPKYGKGKSRTVFAAPCHKHIRNIYRLIWNNFVSIARELVSFSRLTDTPSFRHAAKAFVDL